MSHCHGNGRDHCCYIGGVECSHLRRDVEGRRFACGLRVDLGSWDAVHAAPEYEPVRVALREAGIAVDCGEWPQARIAEGVEPGPWACCFGGPE